MSEEPSNENPPKASVSERLLKLFQGPAKEDNLSFWCRFAYNLGIGLVVFVLAILLGKTGTGEELADKGFDILTLLEKEWYSERSVRLSDVPVYFIEITQGDHERWKDREITSRDKLARLVEAAYEKGADVIVLDILFDKPASGDGKLTNAFGNLTSHGSLHASTKVILPVQLAGGKIMPNIFDDLIQRYPDTFWRGLSYIQASGSKALFRYWVPKDKGETQNGGEEVVWGIPALAAAVMAEKDRTLRMDRKEYVFLQRIRYRLIPQTRSTLRITMPAAEFESAGKNPLPSLRGKIVVIGNNSPDMGDIYRTPVGALPGMYILGNAINSVFYGLRAPVLPPGVTFVFQLIAILVAAVAFTRYNSSKAHFMTESIYLIILLPLGCFMYLTQGDLYSYMLPVIAMRLRMTLCKQIEKLKGSRILNFIGRRRKRT